MGATLAESSLVVALFVVASLAALQFMSDEGEEATLEQIDCVEQRPPTAGCQIPAIVQSSTTSIAVTVTTAPPPPPPEAGAAWTIDPTATAQPSGWLASGQVELRDADTSNPVEGAQVQFSITIPGFPSAISVTCTSDVNGVCAFSNVALPDIPDATQATVSIVSINSNPPVTSYPEPKTMTLP